MDIKGLHSAKGHCYLQYSQLYYALFEIIHWLDIWIKPSWVHTMSTNGSPLKTSNMAATGRLFGSQQWPDDYLGASDADARNSTSKHTQCEQPRNQYHPPPGYGYLPLQPPFLGTPQFYHPAPFNMTPRSQPSSGATEGYLSYGPTWEAYDFLQGGCGGP